MNLIKRVCHWERRCLTVMAVTALLLCMTLTVGAQEPVDISGHWAESQISKWLDQGLIKGYDDGTLNPNGNVTRAEFMTMVNKAFGYTKESESVFTDVKVGNWFFSDVMKADAAGYITGNPDGSMRPNSPISRQEAAVIISRILKMDTAGINSSKVFGDAGKIPDWSRNGISAVVNSGYMIGYPDGTYRPTNNISRAEAVIALDKVVGTLYNKVGVYGPQTGTQTVTGNVTVSQSDVTLKNLIIEGNLYLTEGIGDGHVTLENVTVKGTTVVSGGGMNSIIIINTTLGPVTIDVPDGAKVRLVASGSSKVGDVNCYTNAKLEENNLEGEGFITINIPSSAGVDLVGSFSEVTVGGENADITITGTVGTLTVQGGASSAEIAVSKGSTVNTMTLNAPTDVTGEGTIQTVNLNASGTTIEQQPKSVNVADNVTGIVNGITVGESTNSTSSRGGGSGGDSNKQDGTKAYPYQINTAEDLNAIRGGVTGYESWNLTKSYKLMADIDLSVYGTGEGWVPVGNWDGPFTGSFNGNGYTIKNLYINRTDDDNDYDIGLFGITEGAAIEKVTLTNADITGCGYVGGIVGKADSSTTIDFCSVSGDIKAMEGSIGGIVGSLYESTVSNCYAVGNVSATGDSAGGIAGYNYEGTIEYSYAACNVSANEDAGGLVGYNEGTVDESNYVLGGSVTSIDNGYEIRGEKSFGRITGNNDGGTANGNALPSLKFYVSPMDVSGQNFSGMTGVNGTDASGTIGFTGWDFTSTWKTTTSEKPIFIWQAENTVPDVPFIKGVANAGTFYSVTPTWTTEAGVDYVYVSTLSKDGGTATSFIKGSTINTEGTYLLKITATKTSSGLKSTASMAFTIDPTPLPVPEITGVTESGIYNAALPNPGYISYYDCVAALSTNGGISFAPYSADLFEDAIITDYVYKVTTKALTYPEVSSQVSFKVYGAGTNDKPFLIYTATDLKSIDDGFPYAWGYKGNIDVEGEHTPLYYDLKGDIDLTSIENWQPLGGSFAFCGIFDGGGYTISNLVINKPSDSYIGLFSQNEGEISNLRLTNVSVSGSSITGGLVGENYGLISGCTIGGIVSGSNYIGGLVGNNYGSSATVMDCSSSVTVSAIGDQGGGSLVGNNSGSIENSLATGDVTGNRYLGGLVGRTASTSVITKSFASGSVTSTTGGETGSAKVIGGLVGENLGLVTLSYATGAVNDKGDGGTYSGAGGLVGNNANAASIYNSYATGNVTGKQSVGGISGLNWGSISKCYATGSLTGDSSVGGIAGSNYGTITLSFDKDTAAMNETNYTAAGWDFVAVWIIAEGGYPTLR